MWVMLSDSFLSIVEDLENKNNLLVRARRRGDIKKVFPEVEKEENTPNADYAYRASISRELVAHRISTEVLDISYPNFKDSVSDHLLHVSYLKIWQIMVNLQESQSKQKGANVWKKSSR